MGEVHRPLRSGRAHPGSGATRPSLRSQRVEPLDLVEQEQDIARQRPEALGALAAVTQLARDMAIPDRRQLFGRYAFGYASHHPQSYPNSPVQTGHPAVGPGR